MKMIREMGLLLEGMQVKKKKRKLLRNYFTVRQRFVW